jgi:hypothetical protein
MVRFRTGRSVPRSIHGYRRCGLLAHAGSSNNGKSSKMSNLTGNFVLEFTRNSPLTRRASLTLPSVHSRELVHDLPLI